MERTELEELVRRALLDVPYQEYLSVMAEADTIAYTPSQRYLDWEKKFFADPFKSIKPRQDEDEFW